MKPAEAHKRLQRQRPLPLYSCWAMNLLLKIPCADSIETCIVLIETMLHFPAGNGNKIAIFHRQACYFFFNRAVIAWRRPKTHMHCPHVFHPSIHPPFTFPQYCWEQAFSINPQPAWIIKTVSVNSCVASTCHDSVMSSALLTRIKNVSSWP